MNDKEEEGMNSAPKAISATLGTNPAVFVEHPLHSYFQENYSTTGWPRCCVCGDKVKDDECYVVEFDDRSRSLLDIGCQYEFVHGFEGSGVGAAGWVLGLDEEFIDKRVVDRHQKGGLLPISVIVGPRKTV
jgi:hypothetical protein